MKDVPSDLPALATRIIDLNASESLKTMANLNGFITLADIVNSDLDKLPLFKGSNMHVFLEVVNLLQSHGCRSAAED